MLREELAKRQILVRSKFAFLLERTHKKSILQHPLKIDGERPSTALRTSAEFIEARSRTIKRCQGAKISLKMP
jgi:hypothetical protein